MKRYTIVLNFGYVESQRLAYMPWSSKQKFRDAKEALVDLANYLKDEYLAGNEKPLKKCCTASHIKDPLADYCSKCGYNIAEPAFDGEEFCDWLRQLDTDTDTFAGLVEWDPEARWIAGNLEGMPNPRFVYNAEWVLAAAVGHAHHGDITFDKICKNRTKSRKDSFTYY